MKHQDKISAKDYEKLGRLLVNIGETGVVDKKKLYKLAFLKGLFSGFGGVVGATIVIAVFLWILSLLGEVPFVGQIADTVEETINSR